MSTHMTKNEMNQFFFICVVLDYIRKKKNFDCYQKNIYIYIYESNNRFFCNINFCSVIIPNITIVLTLFISIYVSTTISGGPFDIMIHYLNGIMI